MAALLFGMDLYEVEYIKIDEPAALAKAAKIMNITGSSRMEVSPVAVDLTRPARFM
jgi:hypothetical protein